MGQCLIGSSLPERVKRWVKLFLKSSDTTVVWSD